MEVIRRKLTVSKDTIHTGVLSTNVMQVSYNSFGHLVLRFFDPNEGNEDVLVVLDTKETYELFQFVSKIKL